MSPAISLSTPAFNSSERFRLSWSLTWPCALFGFSYELIRKLAAHSESQNGLLDLTIALLWLFLATPIVVRRAFALEYPGFRIFVHRSDSPSGTQRRTHLEGLSVGWLLSWRSLGIFFLGGIVIAFGALALSPTQRPSMDPHTPIGFLLSNLASFAIFYFWLVGAALKKQYSRFTLRLEPNVAH